MTAARALAALLALGTALAADLGAQVVVGPRTTAIPVVATGDTIVVPVVADLSFAGGASLGSVTARLRWRPGTLRFLGMSAGTFAAPAINNDSAAGELRFAAASVAGATGTPTLINARFQAIGPVGDTTTLNLTIDELSAAGTLAPLPNVATAALVCVGSVGGRWGDVTGNDTVQSNDALVIVTHAVGLSIAPFTVNNGDVDSSGAVTSRDALIVLSHAVGLNVSAFRVNQVRPSLCGAGTPPASVLLTPGTAQLRPGDRVPLAAVARDASTAIVHTPPVSWLTRDATVATVDAAGEVTAIGAGTTRIVAVVAPGVMDSVTVGVATGQRVWFVNGAHSNPVEHGSQAYPFSTLAQALAAAVADDTIRVAVARYGEQLDIRVPLTILGDSTAQGFPVIRPVSGAAIKVDPAVGAGTVTLRRLDVPDADGALHARGAGGLLEVDRLVVTNSRGIAIIAKSFGTLLVTGGGISGAVNTGLEVDSTPQVLLFRTKVDMVAGSGPGQPGYRALVAKTGSLFTLDSTELRGGRSDVRGFAEVNVRASRIGDGHGPMFVVTGADSIEVFATRFIGGPATGGHPDTGAVLLDVLGPGWIRADSIAISGPAGLVARNGRMVQLRRVSASIQNVGGAAVRAMDGDTVVLARSSLIGGDARIERTTIGSGLAILDTVALSNAGAKVFGYAALRVHGGSINGASDNGLYGAAIDHARIERLEVRNTVVSTPANFGPFAIFFESADTVLLDSVWTHDNQAGAFSAEFADTVDVFRSRFDNSYQGSSSGQRASVRLFTVTRSRMARSRIDDRLGAPQYSLLSTSSLGFPVRAVVDTTVFAGAAQYGVLMSGLGGGSSDTLIVRGSTFTAGGVPFNTRFYGIYAQALKWTQVTGSSFDSLSSAAVLMQGGAGVLSRNVLAAVGAGLYDARGYDFATASTIDSNQVTCLRQNSTTGILFGNGSGTATGNTITDCRRGFQLSTGQAGVTAIIRQNTLALDSSAEWGIAVGGQYSQVVVAGNDITSRDTISSHAIELSQSGSAWGSTRVDSNFVHDFAGKGIMVFGFHGSLGFRGNDVRRLASTTAGPVTGIELIVNSPMSMAGNTIREIKGHGIDILNGTGPLPFDSNIVADDSLTGLNIGVGTSVQITGRYNRFSRNRIGIQAGPGSGTLDSSAFQGNTLLGADAHSGWNLSNNWWGHPSGPRCGVPCTGALGDSLTGSITTFTPVLADSAGGRIPNGVAPLRPVAGARTGLRAGSATPALPPERRRPSAAVIAERARIAALPREPLP